MHLGLSSNDYKPFEWQHNGPYVQGIVPGAMLVQPVPIGAPPFLISTYLVSYKSRFCTPLFHIYGVIIFPCRGRKSISSPKIL